MVEKLRLNGSFHTTKFLVLNRIEDGYPLTPGQLFFNVGGKLGKLLGCKISQALGKFECYLSELRSTSASLHNFYPHFLAVRTYPADFFSFLPSSLSRSDCSQTAEVRQSMPSSMTTHKQEEARAYRGACSGNKIGLYYFNTALSLSAIVTLIGINFGNETS